MSNTHLLLPNDFTTNRIFFSSLNHVLPFFYLYLGPCFPGNSLVPSLWCPETSIPVDFCGRLSIQKLHNSTKTLCIWNSIPLDSICQDYTFPGCVSLGPLFKTSLDFCAYFLDIFFSSLNFFHKYITISWCSFVLNIQARLCQCVYYFFKSYWAFWIFLLSV